MVNLTVCVCYVATISFGLDQMAEYLEAHPLKAGGCVAEKFLQMTTMLDLHALLKITFGIEIDENHKIYESGIPHRKIR